MFFFSKFIQWANFLYPLSNANKFIDLSWLEDLMPKFHHCLHAFLRCFLNVFLGCGGFVGGLVVVKVFIFNLRATHSIDHRWCHEPTNPPPIEFSRTQRKTHGGSDALFERCLTGNKSILCTFYSRAESCGCILGGLRWCSVVFWVVFGWFSGGGTGGLVSHSPHQGVGHRKFND